MSWFTTFVRPKINALMPKKDTPDNLWDKCTHCEQMIFHRELINHLYVCHHCDYHMRMPVKMRLDSLFDGGDYTRVSVPSVPLDPLKFKDSKKYTDRLKTARTLTGEEEGILVAEGTIGGHPLVVAAFDFSFIGGSMGMA
ncbi:MAG: acetyl-CoA carboxylase carboxyl transferase subunit beta, partial [Caedimonadaceae bacterium]